MSLAPPSAVPAAEDAASPSSPFPSLPSTGAATPAPASPGGRREATSGSACCCRCTATGWLKACTICQFLLALLRLLCPRPLQAAGNVFLVFLGWGQDRGGSLVRLFFLAFFSLVLGVSDAFWLIVKCTGPYGMAWLDPKFYWKPFVLAPHGALSSPPPAGGAPGSISPPLIDGPHNRMLPPEKPPAIFQIYLELATFCISPIVW